MLVFQNLSLLLHCHYMTNWFFESMLNRCFINLGYFNANIQEFHLWKEESNIFFNVFICS